MIHPAPVIHGNVSRSLQEKDYNQKSTLKEISMIHKSTFTIPSNSQRQTGFHYHERKHSSPGNQSRMSNSWLCISELNYYFNIRGDVSLDK